MATIYRLRDDVREIRQAQDATARGGDYGLFFSHGLFGSSEWWERFDRGEIEVHTDTGVISEVYTAGHNDWPEFRMRRPDGTESTWPQMMLDATSDNGYREGLSVEVDYVLQRRQLRGRPRPETKCIVEVRIGTSA